MSPFQFYESNLEALLPSGHKEIVLEALTQWKADTRYQALTEAAEIADDAANEDWMGGSSIVIGKAIRRLRDAKER